MAQKKVKSKPAAAKAEAVEEEVKLNTAEAVKIVKEEKRMAKIWQRPSEIKRHRH